MVFVKELKDTSGINFVLRPSEKKGKGAISGQIKGEDGTALRDCYIYAYGEDYSYSSVNYTKTDENGFYKIEGLHSGKFKLHCRYYGNGNFVNKWYKNAQSFEKAAFVMVKEPDTRTGINFILDYPGYIQGFLTDNIGHRLVEDDHNIFLFIFDADTGGCVTNGYNTFTGGYQVGLLGGNYKLAAVSVYSNWQPSQDFLARTFYFNGQSYSDPNSQSLNLVPKAVRKLDDLKMSIVNGSIIGMIYDKNTKLPLKDAAYLLFAFDEEGYLAKISTYGDDSYPITGRYKLAGLRPGNYCVFLALLIDDEIFLFFYPDVTWGEKFISVTPKIEIPFNAQAVVVGEGETKGINFYFQKTTNDVK